MPGFAVLPDQSPAQMAREEQAEGESGSEDADLKEAASSEAEPMSEDEAASSPEEASSGAEEGSEEEESDSDAPKVELPNRTTRGKRMVLDQESGEGQVASDPWALQGLHWITMQPILACLAWPNDCMICFMYHTAAILCSS